MVPEVGIGQPTNTTGSKPNVRKRQAHRKSRLGCRNCKVVRRVKCDEGRPMCTKCADYGVVCNYDTRIPDLQPLPCAAQVTVIDNIARPPATDTQIAKGMFKNSLNQDKVDVLKYGIMLFDVDEMARIYRFQTRTVKSIGNARGSLIFQKEILRMASCHRFLMHFVLSVTACHDRFLMGPNISKPSADETYHLSQAVKVFQEKLLGPIQDHDRDALFIAASLLGLLTFGSIEASTVEEAWPLKSSDLNWLHLSDGKKSIWQMTDPSRNDSAWRQLTVNYVAETTDTSGHGLQPTVFDHLMSEQDTSESAPVNPYHQTVKQLTALLELECNDQTWVKFLAFMMHMEPAYKLLLESKDPWAMLMLSYWYTKVCCGQWWITRRAILEGLAICLYIERYYIQDTMLQEAISYPKAIFERLRRTQGLSSA